MSTKTSLRRLRKLRQELGTRRAAELLGMPAPSLRRILSTKRVSQRIEQRLESALERRAIQAEPLPTRIPEYGPEKLRKLPERRAALARDIRHTMGEQALSRQEIQKGIRFLNKRGMRVPKHVQRELAAALHMEQLLRKVEVAFMPDETEFDEIIRAITNLERQAPEIARRYGVSTRAIYCLFFSPPSYGKAS